MKFDLLSTTFEEFGDRVYVVYENEEFSYRIEVGKELFSAFTEAFFYTVKREVYKYKDAKRPLSFRRHGRYRLFNTLLRADVPEQSYSLYEMLYVYNIAPKYIGSSFIRDKGCSLENFVQVYSADSIKHLDSLSRHIVANFPTVDHIYSGLYDFIEKLMQFTVSCSLFYCNETRGLEPPYSYKCNLAFLDMKLPKADMFFSDFVRFYTRDVFLNQLKQLNARQRITEVSDLIRTDADIISGVMDSIINNYPEEAEIIIEYV